MLGVVQLKSKTFNPSIDQARRVGMVLSPTYPENCSGAQRPRGASPGGGWGSPEQGSLLGLT